MNFSTAPSFLARRSVVDGNLQPDRGMNNVTHANENILINLAAGAEA